MKLTKMSLVAALLVGTSAFAVDNIQVSGDANLFYSTTDKAGGTANYLNGDALDKSGTLFDKDSSAADASLNLSVSADLAKNDLVTVSGKASYTVLTTLGLENNFVSNVWGGAHTATPNTGNSYASNTGSHPGSPFTGAKVENANYFTEAYLTIASGNSAAQLGRMELDTPIAFTEKWSAEKNTFEAAVVMNKDIPDTTIVAAYIGNGNGNETFGTGDGQSITYVGEVGLPDSNSLLSNVQTLNLSTAAVVNGNGQFGTFGSDGAYALAVVNNSFKPLTVQAWYYNVSKLATAYWLQADLACEMVPGLMAGVQYSGMTLLEGSVVGNTADVDSDAMAAMLGYEMKDVVTVKVAYSQVGEDMAAGYNVATATGNTKLYTKTFWNYGKNVVTAADTTAYKVSVSSPVNGLFDVCASYTSADQSDTAGNTDLDEIALVVKKSFGPLDAKLAVMNVDDSTVADKYNMVQAYLTLNF
jgi:hypothetical protein